jgi:protease-4
MIDPLFIVNSGELVGSILDRARNIDAQKTETEIRIPEMSVDIFNADGVKVSNGYRGEIPEGSTAQISMVGAVIKYGDYCTWGADELVDLIYKADRNPNIDLIVLYIDSPGGSVNAIAPFIAAGNKITTKVKVVVDQCCSLGYWAAIAMKAPIYVDNDISAVVGSIGVQLSLMDAIPHYEAQGFKWHRITPPESAEKNKVFEEMLAGNYDRINSEMLSPMAIKFQNAVKAARPGVREYALTGRTFNYEEAVKEKLVDGMAGTSQILADKRNSLNLTEFRREFANSSNN